MSGLSSSTPTPVLTRVPAGLGLSGNRVESETPTDAGTLTRRIRGDSNEAFAMFYEAHFDDAYRLARRATGRDEAFCLDVVQDTMLRVVNSIPVLETERALRAWLSRTVHSVAIDSLRADARRAARERARAGSEHLHTDELRAQVEWLRASLSELPDDDRAMLAQRYARDRTLRSIGLEFGMTPDAAHGRIRRTVARLANAAKGVMP